MTFLKYWSPSFIKIKVYILNYFYERVIKYGLLQGGTICNKKGGNQPGKRQAWGRVGERQGQTEYDMYV